MLGPRASRRWLLLGSAGLVTTACTGGPGATPTSGGSTNTSSAPVSVTPTSGTPTSGTRTSGTPTSATPGVTTSAPSITTSTPAVTSATPASATPTGASTSARPTSARPTNARPTSARPSTPPPTTARCSLSSSLLGRDLETLPTTRRVVALTFDAGANDRAVASILATLRRERVPATFFLTGDFVDHFPTSARAMTALGPVGNHTYHHPDLTTLTDARVRAEIRTAAARISAVTGVDPRPLFRFPFGAVDAHRIALVNGECYVPFRWSVDTLGWKGTSGGQSITTVVNRVLSGARPGEIVLMHMGSNPDDGCMLDAEALPLMIRGLRERGYRFTTLASVV